MHGYSVVQKPNLILDVRNVKERYFILRKSKLYIYKYTDNMHKLQTILIEINYENYENYE